MDNIVKQLYSLKEKTKQKNLILARLEQAKKTFIEINVDPSCVLLEENELVLYRNKLNILLNAFGLSETECFLKIDKNSWNIKLLSASDRCFNSFLVSSLF